jgi:alkylation response protein AidB-like acyl-CoA dehydrogenase
MTLADFSALEPWTVPPDEAEILARFRRATATGLLRHALPEAYGGYADSFEDLCRNHRRLGEVSRDPGLVLAVNAHLWGGIFPILLYGDEAQRQNWLPPLIRGDWLAGHAITESGGGSDVQAMASRAERTEAGFRLDGEKRYITNAPLADWLVVYARLEGAISAFLVSREDPGCRFEGGGLQACRGGATGRVMLEDCRIGPDRLLGRPGAGTQMLQRALELERAFVFAGIAGVMAWQLERVVAHSRTRRSGESHLGRHQAVSHRIADMALRLDTVDLWLRECARRCDAGERLSLAAAETKLYAAEAFLQSSLDAVQILGAAGLEKEAGFAALVVDALAGRLFSGTSEVQKNIIAGLLGTGAGYRGPGVR